MFKIIELNHSFTFFHNILLETVQGGGKTGVKPPYFNRPWHCLYFLPEPQGQGSLG